MMKLSIHAIVTSLNLALAFFSQFYILSVLKAGADSDAFFAALALPQVLITMVNGSLINVLVPLFVGIEKQQLRKDLWGFILIIFALFSVLCICLSLTAPFWALVLAPGFTKHGKELLLELTYIQLIGMILMAISSVIWAYNYSLHKFIRTELAQLISNVLGIITLYFSLPIYGVKAAAWVLVGRLALQLFFSIPYIGFAKPDFTSKIFRITWDRIKPLLGGSIIYKSDPLIDRFLASMAPSGMLSILYLSQQIYSAILQIISKVIIMPLNTCLSMMIRENQVDKLIETYIRKSKLIFYISLSFCVVVLGGFKLATGLLNDYKILDIGTSQILFNMLLLSSGVILLSAIGQVNSNIFYMFGETRILSKSATLSFIIGIFLKFILFYLFGVYGLAIAISVYYFFSYFMIRIKLKQYLMFIHHGK